MKIKYNTRSLGYIVLLMGLVIAGMLIISSRDDAANDLPNEPELTAPDVRADKPNSLDSVLYASFSKTDFSKTSVELSTILNGGPGKDGIPALTNPSFEGISDTKIDGDVQAIIYEGESQTRVYPYSILNWHEIVNDTVDGDEIAVTFCPLCGSAIVYDRKLDGQTLQLGVSGFLRESNMIMYDRSTETLWQQATGEAIIGEQLGSSLDLLEFQLSTVGEAADKHPDAIILSTNTGHSRDYDRNPYSGYSEGEGFVFSPSVTDRTYGVKDIFVAFRHGGLSYATPWLDITNGESFSYEDETNSFVFSKHDGDLSITTPEGERVPFYFEMWFSWAVQHQDRSAAVVIDMSEG